MRVVVRVQVPGEVYADPDFEAMGEQPRAVLVALEECVVAQGEERGGAAVHGAELHRRVRGGVCLGLEGDAVGGGGGGGGEVRVHLVAQLGGEVMEKLAGRHLPACLCGGGRIWDLLGALAYFGLSPTC